MSVTNRRTKQLNLRIPAQLHRQLKMFAAKEERTLEDLGVQIFQELLWREARLVSHKDFSEIVDKTLE